MGVFKKHGGPETQREGACLKSMMVFEIYDEPEPPKDGACLRYVMNRNREMKGVFEVEEEPE